MAIWLLIAAILGLLWAWYWLWCNSHRRQLIAQLPCPPVWRPFFGHVLSTPLKPDELYDLIREYCTQFRDVDCFMVELGPNHTLVFLIRAESVETLLSSTRHIRKSWEYDPLLPWLRTGLLTSYGDKWRSRRRLLTPAFHFRILQDFNCVFNEQSKILVELLKEQGNKPFDIFPYIIRCTLDIICDTAMGQHVSAQTDTNSEYVVAVKRICELISIRQKRPWLWPDVIYKHIPSGREHDRCLRILHGFTDQVIRERRAQLDTLHDCNGFSETTSETEGDIEEEVSLCSGKKKRTFLDLLLHSAQTSGLDYLDIREEVDTFMFEGHDTTAVGIGWALYLIGKHPDVQDRLQTELAAIFGESSRDVTDSDLKELKYLECVIKEAQRLYPSVPMFARNLEEEVKLGSHVVPAGVSAVVITTELHRDPRFFPDPEKFDPERFTLENSAGRHPYAYIPFSAGPRNCIGQKFAMNEEKVVLSWILRHFKVHSLQDPSDMCPKGELILRPGAGVMVKLTER